MTIRLTHIALLGVCSSVTTLSQAFIIPHLVAWTHHQTTQQQAHHHHQSTNNKPYTTALSMAKTTGKGFGKPPPSPPPPTSQAEPTTTTTTTTPSAKTISARQNIEPPLSGGGEALARLRRTEAEARDAELRAIRDLRTVDRNIASAEQSAVIPEQVASRMGMRMLPFVGLPLFGGMGVFVAFWYFATYKGLEFQPSLVAYSTIAVLAVGLLGITYSVMSASWDPETEGSALGISEFQTNLGSIQSGLRRSRENLLLRERMNKIPRDELDGDMRKLEREEERAQRKRADGAGLKEKLEKELE